MARNLSNHSVSPDRGRSSPQRKSPQRRNSSRRERSPPRHRNSHSGTSPSKDKYSFHTKSPEHKRSISPISRSPSPRTKRLKRAIAEKESERSNERNEWKREEKGVKERGTDRETIIDRRERRNGRDEVDKEVKVVRRERRNGRDEVDKEVSVERRERRNERYENDRDKGKERSEKRNEWDGDDRVKGKERREEGQRRHDRDDLNGKSSKSRHGRSASPPDRHQQRPRSHSSELAAERREANNAKGDEQGEDEDDSMTKMEAAEKALEEKQKQQPSFELSGKLAAETNRVRGVTLLFNEPPEARKPDIRWRLYVFKAGEALNEPLYIHRQSCYLLGRERRIADIPTDHPSCSKQHAVIQFRQVEKEQPDGMMKKQIRPYLMDLGSTNKTYLNDNAIEPQRYYELFEKDTVKFGNSSREYVLLHENSAG